MPELGGKLRTRLQAEREVCIGAWADRREEVCGGTGSGRIWNNQKVWDLLLQEELRGENGREMSGRYQKRMETCAGCP